MNISNSTPQKELTGQVLFVNMQQHLFHNFDQYKYTGLYLVFSLRFFHLIHLPSLILSHCIILTAFKNLSTLKLFVPFHSVLRIQIV